MAIFGFLAACVVSFACLSKKSSQTVIRRVKYLTMMHVSCKL